MKKDVFVRMKLTRALVGGMTTGIIVFLAIYLTGNIANWEALEIIQEMKPSLRFTSSAIITATATILALMLTLLSFGGKSERKLRAYHYVRIQWIARLSIFAFIGSLLMLLLLNLPLEKASSELDGYFKKLYYALILYNAVIGGVMVSIILMLYHAANDIILIHHPERDASEIFLPKDDGNTDDQV